MNEVLQTLSGADLMEVTVYGLIINFAIYFGSMALFAALSRFPGARKMGIQQPVLRSDVILSLLTVICNTAVFIFGVYLWKYGFIRLSPEKYWLHVLAEVLLLTLTMDLLMYVFHRLVHFVRYFSRVHARHHDHVSTNLLSLFVLHPVESVGFGLMMLTVICAVPFSAVGISVYLALNSLWGTVGHLNYSVLPPSLGRIARRAFICTSEFHYLHHQHPGFNFGFYSSVWDVMFKTLHPSLRRGG